MKHIKSLTLLWQKFDMNLLTMPCLSQLKWKFWNDLGQTKILLLQKHTNCQRTKCSHAVWSLSISFWLYVPWSGITMSAFASTGVADHVTHFYCFSCSSGHQGSSESGWLQCLQEFLYLRPEACSAWPGSCSRLSHTSLWLFNAQGTAGNKIQASEGLETVEVPDESEELWTGTVGMFSRLGPQDW